MNENQPEKDYDLIVDSYRLERGGITVSRRLEDGSIHTYRQGDVVRLTERKAKELGAVRVASESTIVSAPTDAPMITSTKPADGVMGRIIVDSDEVERRKKEEEAKKIEKVERKTESTTSVVTDTSTLTPTVHIDWSVLPKKSWEEAVALISSATTLDELNLAQQIERRGKNRRSVYEAIEAKRKELTK